MPPATTTTPSPTDQDHDMQLSSITPIATTPARAEIAIAVAPGATVGRGRIQGWDETTREQVDFDADVVAGAVLATGVTDIQAAAGELMSRGWNGKPRDHSGLVGFFRNGDAWDAVALLAPELPGKPLKQLWSVGDLQGLKVADGLRLDAIWQVSDFGYDLRWGTPDTMVPKLP